MLSIWKIDQNIFFNIKRSLTTFTMTVSGWYLHADNNRTLGDWVTLIYVMLSLKRSLPFFVLYDTGFTVSNMWYDPTLFKSVCPHAVCN